MASYHNMEVCSPPILPTVAILCPWLSLDGNPGIFFREQALLAQSFCRPMLVRLVPMSSVKSSRRLVRPVIERAYTAEGLECWTIRHACLNYTPYRFEWSTRLRQALMRQTARHWSHTIRLEGRSIDLVHSQSIVGLADWARQFALALGVPYILGEHDQCGLAGQGRGFINAMMTAVKGASAVTACSRDKIRQFASSRLFFPIESIGNLVNSDYFFPPKSTTQTDEYRIMTIGASSEFKDHRTMFEALSQVAWHFPKSPLRFTWVGCNGWGQDRTSAAHSLLAEFDLGHIKIDVIPSLARKELGNLLRDSHLYVMSSISEGMPVSVLEALACGVPVVTTNCGGVDEVIDHSNGIIVPVSDPVRLADAIVRAINGHSFADPLTISKAILDRYGDKAFEGTLRRLYLQAVTANPI